MELAGLRVGDLTFIGFSRVRIYWRRTKGGKSHTDTINDQEIINLLCDYLIKTYGPIKDIEPGAPLWPSYSNNGRGKAIGYDTLRSICAKHLGTAEFHTLRHTFTELMGEAGASIEGKQAALLHARPDPTQSYARKLHGQANQHVGSIARRLTTTNQHG